jgi:sugar phosphate permease
MRLIGATRPWLVHSPFVTTMPEDKAGSRKVYKDHNLHVLFGVAQGINLPNVFSLLNAHAPSENRGAFMATNGMSLRAGQTIGPLLMAATAGTLGLTGAYLAATALAIVALIIVITLLR